ncbi:hypothetical protein C8R43DRAFT_991113 [Mycena crocata]|nr:hypothetical protein C8R43DRAFT_991113 [Mycena crocata]
MYDDLQRSPTMPVTFSVANHPANPVARPLEDGYTADQILRLACKDQHRNAEEILQFGISNASGVGGRGRDMTAKIPNLVPSNNGFVNTVITAYNQHHALIIRPDDVWLVILSQFNFFVNANAELLRASFVAHEGKEELIITADGNRYSLDFGAMSRQMVDLIEKNVADPTLREWIVPTFSTTTVIDTTVSAVLMMATLKEYFAYGFVGISCGIPRVTLSGEKSDWTDILQRLEKLKEYGVETTAWYHLLRPVIARFVAAFDAPTSSENVDFWQKVAHYDRGGSGPSYYSGWINAFNVFSEKGVWLGHKLDLTAVSNEAPETSSAERFWATYAQSDVDRDLVLDGTPYHRLDSKDVPPACAEVDVKLNDNGEMFDCVMTAGMVGMRVSSSEDLALSADGKNDVVQPVAGWWIFIKKAKLVTARDEMEARMAERKRRYEAAKAALQVQ